MAHILPLHCPKIFFTREYKSVEGKHKREEGTMQWLNEWSGAWWAEIKKCSSAGVRARSRDIAHGQRDRCYKRHIVDAPEFSRAPDHPLSLCRGGRLFLHDLPPSRRALVPIRTHTHIHTQLTAKSGCARTKPRESRNEEVYFFHMWC